jgi:hypothetical protein
VERFQLHVVLCINEARGSSCERTGFVENPTGGGRGMHSVFYIIGVVVVVLAILSLLGLN